MRAPKKKAKTKIVCADGKLSAYGKQDDSPSPNAPSIEGRSNRAADLGLQHINGPAAVRDAGPVVCVGAPRLGPSGDGVSRGTEQAARDEPSRRRCRQFCRWSPLVGDGPTAGGFCCCCLPVCRRGPGMLYMFGKIFSSLSLGFV
jgi:hypothetical protein